MTNTRLLAISILAGVVIGGLAIGALMMLGTGGSAEDEPLQFTLGGEGGDDDGFEAPRVSPAIEKPAMTLIDANGDPYDLTSQTDGKVTLLYVGYTHCPDVCPTHMANIAAALTRVDPDVRDAITVVFATSDPARDTPERLATYLANFNPSFIGLTGSQEQMDDFQRQIGMEPAFIEPGTDDGEGNYEVAHASFIIAYGDDNMGRIVFPTEAGVSVLEHDLPKLVREGVPAN